MIRYILLVLVLGTLGCIYPSCGSVDQAQDRISPRLVTLVVVSGLRGDEIGRFESLWRYGFKTLLEQGRYYSKAVHRRGRTDSASGQATLGTGVSPKFHGVVSNSIFYSPQNRFIEVCGLWRSFCGTMLLKHPTLAERLKRESASSKVVAIGGNRQFVELLTGDSSNLSLWFGSNDFELDAKLGGEYVQAPPWSVRFFDSIASPERISRLWELAALPKPFSQWADLRSGERDRGYGTTFPHHIQTKEISELWQQWLRTPDSDRAIGELSSHLVSRLDLGRDADVDLLVTGFSALGAVGEDFGPFSLERISALMELDRVLGDFLVSLQRATGKRVLVAVTSENGIAPMVEEFHTQNKTGRRLRNQEIIDYLKDILLQRFGNRDLVETLHFPFLQLKHTPLFDRAQVQEVVVNALRAHSAIYNAWRVDELENDPDPIAGAMLESIADKASIDVVLVLKPYYTIDENEAGKVGTRAGSPWYYDRHVPVFLWGNNIQAGRFEEQVSVVDLIRTLGDELKIMPDPLGGNALP